MGNAVLNEKLFQAARDGNLKACAALIAKGADVTAVDASGATPLHYAANSEVRPLCQLLVDSGALVDAVDRGGLTVLGAVRDSGPFMCLVEAGANPFFTDQRSGTAGLSPLLLVLRDAAVDGFDDDIEILQFCIEKFGRASVFAHLSAERSALVALEANHPALAAVLRSEETIGVVGEALGGGSAARQPARTSGFSPL